MTCIYVCIHINIRNKILCLEIMLQKMQIYQISLLENAMGWIQKDFWQFFLENIFFDLRFLENMIFNLFNPRKGLSTRKWNLIQHDGYAAMLLENEVMNCHLKKVVAFLSDVYPRKWMGRGNNLEPKNRSKNTSKSDFSRQWKTRLPRFPEEIRTGIYQRKLGSNTSNRIVRLDLDKGCCETLHYITIHHKRIDLDEGWCETLHYTTTYHKKNDLDEGWCATLHYITIHHKRFDLDEGWCATLPLHNNISQKKWPWWRLVCDFTLHNNTSQKMWPWWRVVCDFTLHNKHITKELTLIKGDVRL